MGKKSRKIRCANPECDKQVRCSRTTKKWCSEKCKKAVSRQHQRAADQQAADDKTAKEAKPESTEGGPWGQPLKKREGAHESGIMVL